MKFLPRGSTVKSSRSFTDNFCGSSTWNSSKNFRGRSSGKNSSSSSCEICSRNFNVNSPGISPGTPPKIFLGVPNENPLRVPSQIPPGIPVGVAPRSILGVPIGNPLKVQSEIFMGVANSHWISTANFSISITRNSIISFTGKSSRSSTEDSSRISTRSNFKSSNGVLLRVAPAIPLGFVSDFCQEFDWKSCSFSGNLFWSPSKNVFMSFSWFFYDFSQELFCKILQKFLLQLLS